MSQYKNNQVINSVSNGNGNWMARDEEEYDRADSTLEHEICTKCGELTHFKKMYDGECKACVEKELGY